MACLVAVISVNGSLLAESVVRNDNPFRNVGVDPEKSAVQYFRYIHQKPVNELGQLIEKMIKISPAPRPNHDEVFSYVRGHLVGALGVGYHDQDKGIELIRQFWQKIANDPNIEAPMHKILGQMEKPLTLILLKTLTETTAVDVGQIKSIEASIWMSWMAKRDENGDMGFPYTTDESRLAELESAMAIEFPSTHLLANTPLPFSLETIPEPFCARINDQIDNDSLTLEEEEKSHLKIDAQIISLVFQTQLTSIYRWLLYSTRSVTMELGVAHTAVLFLLLCLHGQRNLFFFVGRFVMKEGVQNPSRVPHFLSCNFPIDL